MDKTRALYLFGGLVALMALTKQETLTDDRVKRMAEAIARAEGYGVQGAIPTLRNNPGNLKMSGDGSITSYLTPADGWEALYKQIRLMLTGASRVYKPTMTLSEVARLYTGEAAYMNWARNVASYLGVSVDTPFGEAV